MPPSALWTVLPAAGAFLGWWWCARLPGRLAPVRWRASLAVAGVVAVAVYPAQRLKDMNFFFGDEAIIFSVAQAMGEGALLYRDVWEFLQPGSFAALALVFSVFGSGVHVLDACVLVCFAAIAVALHRLVAHAVSPRAGWLAVVAFLLVLFPVGVCLSPHWMSTGAALLAMVCLLRAPPPAPRRHIVGA